MSHLIKNTAAFVHSDIRALERYWQGLRAGRVCPFRAEVDPRDIESRISHLFILEDLGLGNVRFRIAGTALTDLFGMELRGMPVRTMMDMRSRQSFAALVGETLVEPGVGYARLRRSRGPGDLWEIILLPLRSDQGRIDRLIGALHPLEPALANAGDSPLRFTIEEMSITSVDVTAQDGLFDGFAEEAREFVAAAAETPEERPRLTAIEGGRRGAEARPAARREAPVRHHLKIVP